MHDDSLEGFYYVARSLLIHREADLDLFDQAFLAHFKGIEVESKAIKDELLDWLKDAVERKRDLSDEERALLESIDIEEIKRRFEETMAEQTERHDGGNRWIGTGGTSPFGHSGAPRPGIRVGGPGGGPFRSENPEGKPVLGFQYTMGRWMSWTAPQSLEPLYDRAQTHRGGETVLAREGYAVGAIRVDADQFVTAVQVVFMRLLPDGRLDKTDSYTSQWIGEPSEKSPQTLGGTGAPVLGVYGRRAAILDAVGLMLQED